MGSTTSTTSSESESESERADDKNKSPMREEPRLLYQAPMGGLVSRLKRISITSCLISVIGLPLLIYLKNGTWPDAKQIGMGGFAFISASGSTLALHFVFGPYVMDLYEIPVRQGHTAKEEDGRGGDGTTGSTIVRQPSGQEFLYKATVRSILGLTQEVVFDPLTDITRYQGARPFANFVVKDQHVLYCHPELLDHETRLKLLHPNDKNATTADKEKDATEKSKIRRPVDEDDGFL